MCRNLNLNRPVYTLTIGEFIELNKQIYTDVLASIQQPKQEVEKEKEEEILDIKQTAKLLNHAVATIYSLTSRMEIPYFKMQGHKKIYFKRSVLLEWLDDGRRKTKKKSKNDAETYLIKRKKNINIFAI